MRRTTHACGERTRAAKIKLRLLIVKQEILAHLSPETEDLPAHRLAAKGWWVDTGKKINGHERRSTRTSGVAPTNRDRITQRNPEGVNVALFIWGPRNQLQGVPH